MTESLPAPPTPTFSHSADSILHHARTLRSRSGERGPLPIVVGVSGHRDLRQEDIAALEGLVRGIFEDLMARYPASPLVVISPLAEGADRLGARVALDCGAQLVVPLPLPRQLYEDDFETESSRREFEELLGRCDQWFELPLLPGITHNDIREAGHARSEQYGALGAYIVQNSQMLVALWDGVDPTQKNGTGDVVAFNVQGVPERFAPPRSMLNPIERDPVFHIVTPRRSNPLPNGDPLTVRTIYPQEYEHEQKALDTLDVVFRNTDSFNRDLHQLAARIAPVAEQSARGLLPDRTAETLPRSLRATRTLFAGADAMADHFSRYTNDTLKRLFLLVAAAAVIFDIYTHLWPGGWWMLLGYLLLLVGTWFVVRRSEQGGFQSRYLDYRALAEGLRVQFFWNLAGVRDSVADFYLHKQHTELDWIRYAIRIWDIPAVRDRAEGEEECGTLDQRLELVQQHWVEDQFEYYRRAAGREEKKMHRLEGRGGRLVLLGIFLALVQVLMQGLIFRDDPHQPVHVLLVVIALCPIVAGLMIGYAEKRGYGDHAKQYERMSILFANARLHLQRLRNEGDLERARQLVAELGREALMENGDWVLLHRDRPIEVPKG